MRLCVARHGETAYNAEGRYAGSTDVPLNESGITQAKELAQKLRNERFDVAMSSPLLRARQTAEIVCAALNMPFAIIDQFAERGVGVFESLTREEAKRQYPEIWAKNSTRTLDGTVPNGETFREFDARIVTGLQILCWKYPLKRVLLICHGFVSRDINRYCKGLSFEDMHGFSLKNCEIAEYELYPGGKDGLPIRNSDDISLVFPDEKHEEAAAEYLSEHIASGENMLHGDGGLDHAPSYAAWLESVRKNARQLETESGKIPATAYFAVRSGDNRIVGMVNLRHRLNEHLLATGGHIGCGVRPTERRKGYATVMLALALDECRRMGIEEALVTCDSDNIASSRTIERNGGIYQNEVYEDDGTPVRRYQIPLA